MGRWVGWLLGFRCKGIKGVVRVIVQEFIHLGDGVFEGREYDPLSEANLKFGSEFLGVTLEEARVAAEGVLQRLRESPDGMIKSPCGLLRLKKDGDPSVEEMALLLWGQWRG